MENRLVALGFRGGMSMRNEIEWMGLRSSVTLLGSFVPH
jgi:hypothetical protein